MYMIHTYYICVYVYMSTWGGTLMCIGDFPESLSQAILVGIMLVGRLGVQGGFAMLTQSRLTQKTCMHT